MPTQQFVESGRQMTLDEWANLDEDAPGELVDGRLVEDEEVGFLHDLVVGWVIHALRSWVVPRGGLVAASDSRFAVSATSGRKPDVSVYFAGRRPPATGLITVAPDIMIEVVSPRPRDARRDRIEKMAEYAEFGVACYWIVDPIARTLEIFEPGDDGRYAQALGAADGVVTEVPGCDGLSLDLDGLWAEVERLQE